MRKLDDLWEWIVPGLALAALLLSLAPTGARSEERVLAESTVGQGGLICDTTTEVTEFIGHLETSKDAQQAIQAVAGCGILNRPMRMRVVAIGSYKTDQAEYHLVRYDFLDIPGPPQYGIGMRKLAGQDA